MPTPNSIAVLNEAIGKIRKQAGLTEQDQGIIDQLGDMVSTMSSSLKLAKPHVPGSTGAAVNSGLKKPLGGLTQGASIHEDRTRIAQSSDTIEYEFSESSVAEIVPAAKPSVRDAENKS
jgi:hypothetical protein